MHVKSRLSVHGGMAIPVDIAQRHSHPIGSSSRFAEAPGWDRIAALILLSGLAAIFLPTYWDLAYGRNAASARGYEFIVLGVSTWLLWRNRASLMQGPASPRAGWPLVILALLAYMVGRSQRALWIETMAPVIVLAGALLCTGGWTAVRRNWFALLLMLSSVPLPFEVGQALTVPLKHAVSMAATWVLHAVGYPIGRSGVVITIGQYQLLISRACAGLPTMFTLEAMGLLYLNLMGYQSRARNITLALLTVPISITANVIRVILIALVTYHFGDAAGQGFVHGLAGIVLFALALALIITTDALLGRVLPEGRRQ